MKMNRLSFVAMILTAMMVFTACSDKTTPVLVEQGERLNTELQTLAGENPDLIAEASAVFADNALTVDVKLADSLFAVKYITDPLFNFFTACQIKSHLDKNLEVTLNGMIKKEAPLHVTLTDVYGDSHTYTLEPGELRNMVKGMLSQLGYNEAREALFEAFAASKDSFLPTSEGFIKDVTTSFKGGFYAYTVNFTNPNAYAALTSANLKARELKVLEARYARLGTMRDALLDTYKSLGIDGFNLIYTCDDKNTLKTGVTLSNLK